MTTPPSILLTGATGFIGGSILHHLLTSKSDALKAAPITLLLRGEDRVPIINKEYGDRVRTTIYKDIDDLDATTAAAAKADIVINTTLGFHPASAQALVRGLAQRKKETGRDVWIVHTSGTSNVADQWVSKKYVYPEGDVREFDDKAHDILGYMKEREAASPYAQRENEIGVVEKGLELGVQTLVIQSPTIYGKGTGLFNKTSIQLPAYVQSVISHGRSVVVAGGKGVWDHVHVEDLAELYTIVVLDILEKEGKNLPKGTKSIIFSGNGRHSWLEVAQGIADALFAEGKLKDKTVESVDLAEGAVLLSPPGEPNEVGTELGLSSNSRTVSTVARSLGWKPTRGDEAWKQGFKDDVKAVLAKQK